MYYLKNRSGSSYLNQVKIFLMLLFKHCAHKVYFRDAQTCLGMVKVHLETYTRYSSVCVEEQKHVFGKY